MLEPYIMSIPECSKGPAPLNHMFPLLGTVLTRPRAPFYRATCTWCMCMHSLCIGHDLEGTLHDNDIRILPVVNLGSLDLSADVLKSLNSVLMMMSAH